MWPATLLNEGILTCEVIGNPHESQTLERVNTPPRGASLTRVQPFSDSMTALDLENGVTDGAGVPSASGQIAGQTAGVASQIAIERCAPFAMLHAEGS